MRATTYRNLFGSLIFGLGAPLWAQDVRTQTETLLKEADRAPIERVFQVSLQILDLDATEEQLAQALRATTADRSPKGRLAVAYVYRDLATGTVFGKDILDALTPVTEGGDDDARAAAIALLADDSLFNRRLRPNVRGILAKQVDDDLAPAGARIEAARGLWQIGNESEQLSAKKALREFLRSSDPALKARSALTLADLNDTTAQVWDVLQELRDLPTADGRAARAYIQREEERRQFERRLLQLRDSGALGGPSGGAEDDDTYALLREMVLAVRAQHIRGRDFDEQRLLEAAAKGIMESLDKHSSYFTSEEFQRFFFDLNREYGGIGAYVNFDADGFFSIVRPIYSGPAYKEGLRSGDRILEVDGWETAGHSQNEIIARLKGQPDTTVVLKIARPGLQEPQDVSISRAEIRVPSVNAELMPGGIGYAEVTTFAQGTAPELRRAIRKMESDNGGELTGLILDLRNNTGGFMSTARELVEMFVKPRELVVYTAGRNDVRVQEYFTRPGRQVSTEMPIAVLTNSFSASASEITAGALQDHGRATIIGERTYGKGSVQQLLPLRTIPPEPFTDENDNGVRDDWEKFTDVNDNGTYDVGPRMKLTMFRYHLPSGRSVHKEFDAEGRLVNPEWGVTPDIVCDLRELDPKEAWKNAEIFEIFRQGLFREFADNLVEADPTLALQLADGDGYDTAKYPGFDEFFEGLDTRLSRNDVRRWIRYMLRDAVADVRGKAYPGGRAVGDFQEDGQLQQGLQKVLEAAGKPLASVKAYDKVLPVAQAEPEKQDEKK